MADVENKTEIESYQGNGIVHLVKNNGVFLSYKTSDKFFGHYFSYEIVINKKRFLEKMNALNIDNKICNVKMIGGTLPVVILKNYLISKNILINKVIEKDKFELYFDQDNGSIKLKKEDHKTDKVKVFLIDDSPTILKLFRKIFSTCSQVEVIGEALNPEEAEKFLMNNTPDVITLDMNLPKMNGVEFYNKFIKSKKIPTLVVSALTIEDGDLVLSALESGAYDYIKKPEHHNLQEVSQILIEKIIHAKELSTDLRNSKKLIQKAKHSAIRNDLTDEVIVIGASTGGTEAIKDLLETFPKSIPPILIVQHIPKDFSKVFADRLNQMFTFEVKEAEDGDQVTKNRVLIAPGGKHMIVEKNGSEYVVRLNQEEAYNRHRPSVDVLFFSAAKIIKDKCIGILLTGMGNDGAKGLLEIKNAGGMTLAQDQSTCVVFGMPKCAIQLGAANEILPLDQMAECVFDIKETKSKKDWVA